MLKRGVIVLLIPTFLLTSCIATITPPSPTYTALPGTGKSLAQYMTDDQYCRDLATIQTGNPSEVAQRQQIGGMILGALGGGLLGLGFGGSRPGPEIAAGVAAGGIAGTVAGTYAGQTARMTAQQNWDASYLGCMYSLGNKIPGYQEQPAQPSQPAPPPPPPPPPPPR